MHGEFSLPAGAFGRFAVVKLWPEIKTAEDECIARLKIAAQALGIECVEVLSDGTIIGAPGRRVSKDDVDFVLHLHYDTPKNYDAFSFVALWNPVRFYHEWGYYRCSRNLTTHDDFVSCSSDAADAHVARMVSRVATHMPAKFNLYHSTADVIHPPSLGDCKLFYAGINWEAITGGKSRHQEVLKALDKTGLLRIYGPDLWQGVHVWAGYDSYVREVPFDGVSMIDEISKAGVALVLSSQAHKDSELMSNRLFESLAAGALVICDENGFAKKFFGDCLLYIDGRSSAEVMARDITGHLEWARTHPEQALAMIKRAQGIFRDKFTLVRNLTDLYNGLGRRRQQLLDRQHPPGTPAPRVRACFLMPEYSEAILASHIDSIRAQDYGPFEPCLVVGSDPRSRASRRDIDRMLAEANASVRVIEVDYLNIGIHPDLVTRRRLGQVIQQLLDATSNADAFMVVAPNESLFSNHVAALAGALQRNPAVNCAATAAILQREGEQVRSVHECIDFGHVDRNGPPGYGRFMFRMSGIPHDIGAALPYLDGRPLAVLVGKNDLEQLMQATIRIRLAWEFPERTWDEAAENAVIRAYSPEAFRVVIGYGPPRLPVPAAAAAPAAAPGGSPPPQGWRKLLSPSWIWRQLCAIHAEGLPARLKILRTQLGL